MQASSFFISYSNIGVNITNGLVLTNPAPATIGVQQVSPAVMFYGQAWKTTPSTSTNVGMGFYMLPVLGSATPSSVFHFLSQIGGAAPSSIANLNSSGDFSPNGSLYAGQHVHAGPTHGHGWLSSGYMLHGNARNFVFSADTLGSGGDMGLVWGGPVGTATLNNSTNFPSLRSRGETNDVGLLVTRGTNVISALWANVALGSLSFPSNYYATNFYVRAGEIKFASSNGALYLVSATKTNFISDAQ
jgi:hypothetical protein